jgi:hypothetical protein
MPGVPGLQAVPVQLSEFYILGRFVYVILDQTDSNHARYYGDMTYHYDRYIRRRAGKIDTVTWRISALRVLRPVFCFYLLLFIAAYESLLV